MTRPGLPVSVLKQGLEAHDNRQLEECPELLQSAIMVGWCTGLLPAAVAASAVSMVQVLELAPRAVELSIKIGVDAHRKAAAVEDHPGSWARVVKGCPETDLEAMLNQFNATNVSSFPTSSSERNLEPQTYTPGIIADASPESASSKSSIYQHSRIF